MRKFIFSLLTLFYTTRAFCVDECSGMWCFDVGGGRYEINNDIFVPENVNVTSRTNINFSSTNISIICNINRFINY